MSVFKVGDLVVGTPENHVEYWKPMQIQHIINPDSKHCTLACMTNDGDLVYLKLSEVVHYKHVFTVNEQPEKVNTEYVENEQGGVKADGGKPRPTILLKDLKDAVASVVNVLEYGAKKYNRMNYSKVETERYEDSISRHLMSYLAGEKNDPETGEHHLAHMICGAMFIIQKGD